MKPSKKHASLPEIPDKRYFTIGEVGDLCAVKPHVLRYWEQEFSALRPSKRKGSRRYYQRKDILLVRSIRELLYDKGFTISGARRQLKTLPKTTQAQPQAQSQPQTQLPFTPELQVAPAEVTQTTQAKPHVSAAERQFIQTVRKDLEKLLFELKD